MADQNIYGQNDPQDEEEALEQGVDYNDPTQNAQVASGANTIPGAQPVRADATPIGAILENTVGGHGTLGTTSNEVTTPSEVQTPVFGSVSALPAITNEAGQGYVKGVGKASDILAPVAQNASQSSQGQVGQAQNLQNAQDIQQRLAQATQDFDNYQQTYSNFINSPNQGVDPSRYVNNLGVSGKTMTALGMILGGFGAGLTGGPNLAVQTFQNRVQNDINAQATNIHNNLLALSQAQGISMNRVQLANLANTAQASAANNVYTGLAAAANYQALYGETQAARDKAKAVMLQMQQNSLNVENSVANTYKGGVQSNDQTTTGIISYEVRKNAANLKNIISNPNAPAPSHNVQQNQSVPQEQVQPTPYNPQGQPSD